MKNRFSKILVMLMIITTLLFSQGAYAKEPSFTNEDMAYFKSIMEYIKEMHKGEVTNQQLMEGALKGIFDSMDKYTTYYTLEEAEIVLGSINGTYQGIGVSIQKVDDYIVLFKVFAASPAEKAGLLSGDKIAEVDGKSMVGEPIEAVQKSILGAAGTSVKVGVLRNGIEGIKVIEVTRGQIKLNPVSYEIRGDIGYIKIDSFNDNTIDNMREVMKELDTRKIKKVILDLRNNPGGLVDQAVEVAKYFVPEGPITTLNFQSDTQTDVQYHSVLKEKKYELAVLVNSMSASASEILAGAIQDTGAGILIGQKTFGKGKVQNMMPLITPEAYKKYSQQLGVEIVDAYDLYRYGIAPLTAEIIGWIKITTGEYTTPKGRAIDGIGLTPEVLVEDYALVHDIDINSIQKLALTQKLELNDEGIDVYNAEKLLTLLGYDIERPDMVLDQKTHAAVELFKNNKKLWSKGSLNFTVQKALNKELTLMQLEIDKQYAKAVEVLQKP